MSRAESCFRKFSKAVWKTHDSKNPECAILTSNGSNFQIWEEEVNRTLDGVFDTNIPFLSADANFEALGRDKAKSVVILFRTTISKKLWAILGGPSVKTPLNMYKSIKLNCKHPAQKYKLRIVDQLVTLVKSKAPSTKTTLSSWTSTVTKLEQLKVSVSELYDLLLQNGFVVPTGINKRPFEFTGCLVQTQLKNVDLDPGTLVPGYQMVFSTKIGTRHQTRTPEGVPAVFEK
ncbi:hypothetical protein Pst134EA_019219 [Puccinia striiformis f. sp. tritici]|uniref:hypothetical protein n=1 Tax=Puccinia striiformis f. sp. tritici TaxID=168172 RepID=UPI00200793BB|nr:hypothetical protein Pst134EA_019219 [Puccinia striiformis f. sp. tritici]KAH9459068.1 hypothetical protein Pst134EA_019219 [Puccinia striiformis f. sp. tritici]